MIVRPLLLMVLSAAIADAAELQQIPDWHERLPSAPALDISIAERALIVKAMEIMEEREPSRKEMTVSWVPVLSRIKSGAPITIGDFQIFQGALISAQQGRAAEAEQEFNRALNNLRHKLYKEIAAITTGTQR